jgi:oligoendopeptidase F
LGTEKKGHTDRTDPPKVAALPRWNLSDLYPSKDSAEFKKALTDLDEQSQAFETRYKGKVGKLSGQQLGEAIEAYEKISNLSARLITYADLTRAVDETQSAFAADVTDKVRRAGDHTLFFTLEINKLREGDLLEKIAAPKLAQYGPWIGKVRAFKDYQLSDEAEKYKHKMEPVTEEAWRRLFDQVVLDLRVPVRGQKLTEGEAVNIIDNHTDQKYRHEVFAAFGKALGAEKKTFALITNTLADLRAMDDRWRGFENPEDSRHLENQIDKETVDALSKAVRDNYSKTSHRYYEWKAKKAGVARLHPADRNAPLPGDKGRSYTWDEAKEIVLSAFKKLSPEMEKIGREFFDKGWIDAEPRAGKDSGGFSHPATPDGHPYILMNFYGTAGDVMTLAHELGHGIHQVLANKQGHLKSDTPLTLAETASVFGEMLAFRELLSREDDLIARRNMTAAKIEDMLNTVVRQTAFFTFEQKVHGERRDKGELSPERISEIWLETQKASLGPSVNMDVPGAENLWMNVPHFIHTPFYVYAYSFGDCLVNALYDEYTKAADKNDFAQKYETLLSGGGTKRHDRALAEFGLDTTDPEFWKKGLSVIERYIDDLLALDAKIESVLKSKADFKQAGDDATKPATNDNDSGAVRDNDKPVVRLKFEPKGPGGAP